MKIGQYSTQLTKSLLQMIGKELVPEQADMSTAFVKLKITHHNGLRKKYPP